jgi:hypothetical protein
MIYEQVFLVCSDITGHQVLLCRCNATNIAADEGAAVEMVLLAILLEIWLASRVDVSAV